MSKKVTDLENAKKINEMVDAVRSEAVELMNEKKCDYNLATAVVKEKNGVGNYSDEIKTEKEDTVSKDKKMVYVNKGTINNQ